MGRQKKNKTLGKDQHLLTNFLDSQQNGLPSTCTPYKRQRSSTDTEEERHSNGKKKRRQTSPAAANQQQQQQHSDYESDTDVEELQTQAKYCSNIIEAKNSEKSVVGNADLSQNEKIDKLLVVLMDMKNEQRDLKKEQLKRESEFMANIEYRLDSVYDRLDEKISKLDSEMQDMAVKDIARVNKEKNIVLHNLPEGRNLLNQVHSLIRDGLRLNITVMKAERKQSSNDRKPGLVIVTCKSVEDKWRVMGAKRNLKHSQNFGSVGVDCDKSKDQRDYEASIRAIVNAIGDEKLQLRGQRVINTLHNRALNPNPIFRNNRRRSSQERDQRGLLRGNTGQRGDNTGSHPEEYPESHAGSHPEDRRGGILGGHPGDHYGRDRINHQNNNTAYRDERTWPRSRLQEDHSSHHEDQQGYRAPHHTHPDPKSGNNKGPSLHRASRRECFDNINEAHNRSNMSHNLHEDRNHAKRNNVDNRNKYSRYNIKTVNRFESLATPSIAQGHSGAEYRSSQPPSTSGTSSRPAPDSRLYYGDSSPSPKRKEPLDSPPKVNYTGKGKGVFKKNGNGMSKVKSIFGEQH